MIFVLFLILCLCLHRIQLKNSGFHQDYLSIEKTASIKGVFILLVILRHFTAYVKFSNSIDLMFLQVDHYLEQLIVTMFLFYSGYGIFESIKKKKTDYVNEIPANRIFKVLFEFDIAIVLFLLIDLMLGYHYSLINILLAFAGWESIGNSAWFIFAILAAYLLTYISFKMFRNNYLFALVSITILSIVYIVIMQSIKESWWYNTILCYVAGMWYSNYKKNIEDAVCYNSIVYILSLVATTILFVSIHPFVNNVVIHEIWSWLFVFIVVLITMKLSINNKILNWLGVNTFSIFILQRIPMIIFKYIHMDTYNLYVYFTLCLVSTMIISWIFSKFTNTLYSRINKRRAHVERQLNA